MNTITPIEHIKQVVEKHLYQDGHLTSFQIEVFQTEYGDYDVFIITEEVEGCDFNHSIDSAMSIETYHKILVALGCYSVALLPVTQEQFERLVN